MADLDNFFAKRDKKKLKGPKVYSPEEMAKRLEENERKEEKAVQQAVTEAHIQVKKETPKEDRAETPEPIIEVKDEWKDFEEKQQVDVSDLKVGNLNLSDEENDGSDADCDEDGNNADGKKDSVWSVEPKAKPSVCDAVDLAMEEGNDVKATVAAVRASEAKYVPPRAAAEMAAMPLPRGGRRKKNAPDLKSEEAFPTLGMKPKKSGKVKKDGPGTPSQSSNGIKMGSHTPAGGNTPGAYLPPHLRMKSNNRFGGLTDHGDKC